MKAWPTPASLVTEAVLSEPVRLAKQQVFRGIRLLRREPSTLEVFVRLNDPYSLLLLRELPALLEAFSVELRLHWLTDTVPPEYEPNADKRARYATRDAALLAAALGDGFDPQPAAAMHDAVAAILVAITEQAQDDWLGQLIVLAEAWWASDTVQLAPAIERIEPYGLEKARQHGRRAIERLLELGHYEAASLYYDGSWYVGVDRLEHLLVRLDRLGLIAKRDAARRLRTRQRALRPSIARSGVADIEFFFSFRSPFSYLAAATTFALAKAGTLNVQFRPVLPMVKRGQPLPTIKRNYIVADANREARRLGVPFGRVADPLDAVEDLIRVAKLAEREGRTADYVLAVGEACWARGIDLARSENLVTAAAEAGLRPRAVERALGDDTPLAEAAQNMQHLNAAGLWGVPSFRIGTRAFFGQDRLALMLNEANVEGT
ncbi:MAG: DsbA family protein [Pseudomonadota bacterium]